MKYTITLSPMEYHSLIRLLQDTVALADFDQPWHQVVSHQTSSTLIPLLKKLDPDFKFREKSL